MNGMRWGRSKLILTLGGVLLALVLIALWWANRNGDEPIGGPDDERVSLEQYRQAVEAVSATEEADFRRALDRWEQLVDVPGIDADVIRLNQAVTVLKWIDQLTSELDSGGLELQQRQRVEEELDAALDLVGETVEVLSSVEGSRSRVALVEAALLQKRAARVEGSQANEFRNRAADLLAERLEQDTGHLLLAGKFDELATDLARQRPELMQLNADFLLAAHNENPRNLFILKRTAEILMANQDPRLTELLQPSLELTRSMRDSPSVSRIIDRLDPDALVTDVRTAIENDQWSQVRRLQGWLNTMIGMPAFKSDSRLAKPDVLALLDTNFLRPIVEQLPSREPSDEPPIYDFVEIASQPLATAWYDVDHDLQFEVAIVEENVLRFVGLDGTEVSTVNSVEGDFQGVRGLVPVDLFEVDLPSRPQVTYSVADMMQSDNAGNAPSQEADDGGDIASQPADAEPTDDESAEPALHNTLQELLIWGSEGIQIVSRSEDGEYLVLEAETGLEQLQDVIAVALLDFESDGDLDLALSTSDGLVLMRNNGNRTFQDISQYSSLPETASQLVAGDFDYDTTLDLYATTRDGQSLTLLQNLRHTEFRQRELEGAIDQPESPISALAVADVNGDSSWDLLALSDTQTHITTTRLLDDGGIVPLARSTLPHGGHTLLLADVNNDGYLDLLVGGDSGCQLFLGDGEGGFGQLRNIEGLQGEAIVGLQGIDADGDGTIEILARTEAGTWIGHVDAEPGGAFVGVRVRGINDVNGGGRINHYAIGSTLQLWAEGQLQSRTVIDPVTHFGLGNRTPDDLRIIFTNGLTQNVEAVEPNSLIQERQELRGSCPFVYGWNGERFELITDLLWNAPLGLQIARGVTLPDRRWEHLLLPGELMQPRDGMYELRVTEELWEVAYFDYFELTAVDHPVEQEVFTNEKVGPAELAEPRLYAFDTKFPLQSARDTDGNDVTDRLATKDQVYVQPFQRQICQGLCEPHYIELEFGDLPSGEQLCLVLTGWMHPTDTSLNIGIDQNARRQPPEPPSLWVVDDDGKWVCVQPYMGFPGGKPKSIVVDLSDAFLSDDHRVRIAGSQEIYWDQAFVARDGSTSQLRARPLEIASAALHYRGFSRLLPRASDQPHWYDYHEVDRRAKWPPLEGPFTRFGDVLELVTEDDDCQVVMTAGDEIVLRFAMPEEPVPDGYRRDFVLKSVGWDKDADLNTLAGFGSLPLPFAAQQAYPPPPSQSAASDRVWRKNASTLIRHRPGPPGGSPEWAKSPLGASGN